MNKYGIIPDRSCGHNEGDTLEKWNHEANSIVELNWDTCPSDLKDIVLHVIVGRAERIVTVLVLEESDIEPIFTFRREDVGPLDVQQVMWVVWKALAAAFDAKRSATWKHIGEIPRLPLARPLIHGNREDLPT